MSDVGETLFQCLLGIQCRGFTMVASDQMNTQSIIVMNDDEDKLQVISDCLVLGMSGNPGDRLQFGQYIAKNLALYQMRNRYQLDTAAIVHFIRKTLVDYLKSGNPYPLNLLVAGYDSTEGGQLYSMDYLAASVKTPFATHGCGGYLSLGILDRYYKPTLSESEAYEVLKMCVREIHQRLFFNLAKFQVKVVSARGVTLYPTINSRSFVTKR